jgi:hypothetical protein
MGTTTLTVEGTTVGTVAEGKGVVIRRSVSEQDSARIIAGKTKLMARFAIGAAVPVAIEP